MSTNTAQQLILQHSTNPVNNPGYETKTDKVWARAYKPIKKVTSHTMTGADGMTYANFEGAFLPLQADDELRFRQTAVPPNNRHWRLETEADCENWFHTEVVNVVLSAWHAYPAVTQTSHTKPVTEENIAENVDCVFSVRVGNTRRTVAIGEMKRNLLEEDWQDGTKHAQSTVGRFPSREAPVASGTDSIDSWHRVGDDAKEISRFRSLWEGLCRAPESFTQGCLSGRLLVGGRSRILPVIKGLCTMKMEP
ncbi:hypothetical protein FDENT_3074 [Fusarium denticulatum]|uniref:Uncharacterized protein n=1 Tax=Fusarium denticulatum TaxID=48507 RepID=A0A8H6CU16_9HYPO|nr:hypothetical protein FDENT_3074 [Fusarium denticulatum]